MYKRQILIPASNDLIEEVSAAKKEIRMEMCIRDSHGIDEESQHEVNQHATYNDEQALPCRFAAKLV